VVENDKITPLMRDAIARPLHQAYRDDPRIGACRAKFLDGEEATAAALGRALAEHRPGVVVTTSHGKTWPLDDPAQLAAGLGLLHDAGKSFVTPEGLLSGWKPDGAIWYAHACCSAGTDPNSAFADLARSGSRTGLVLAGLSRIPAQVSPLPRALLGAKSPLRAFIGHVEPTFHWSLESKGRSARLTRTFHDDLFKRRPIGWALHTCYTPIGSLLLKHTQLLSAYRPGDDYRPVIEPLLVCRDILSTVLLGDPAVVVPAP
jgi:hypothetical protein